MSSTPDPEDLEMVHSLEDDQSLAKSNIQSAESPSDTKAIIPTPRFFTYNSGYGDFCFLRLVDAYPKPPLGVVDSFVRSGTFPFMKLPKEIRYEIYKLVLAPLLSKHMLIPDERRYMIMKIQDFEDVHYKHFLAMVRSIIERKKNPPSSALLKVYGEEEKEVAVLYKRFLHPTRTHAYEFTFPRFAIEAPTDHGCEKIPPSLIASIRNLSNVNCQIREELGISAWASSFLIVENGAFAEALSCLRERPAIYGGVKALLITIRWAPTWRSSDENPTCTELIKFVDQHLQLVHLRIKLTIPVKKIWLLVNGGKRPKWINALRGMKCVGSFALHTTYTDANWPDTGFGASDYKQIIDRVGELENVLKPLVLTGSDTKSEVDWHRAADDEYEEPGFDYQILADGSFGCNLGGHTRRGFQFQKDRSFKPRNLAGWNRFGSNTRKSLRQ